MRIIRNIDVSTLDPSHRRALEEVINCELAANQQLIISVIDVPVSTDVTQRPTQTLDDWTHVYDGLSDQQVEDIDAIAKTRADFSREHP